MVIVAHLQGLEPILGRVVPLPKLCELLGLGQQHALELVNAALVHLMLLSHLLQQVQPLLNNGTYVTMLHYYNFICLVCIISLWMSLLQLQKKNR